MTIRDYGYKLREMDSNAERKLIARAQITDLATPEEKAGIVSTLRKAGLLVYQYGDTLYIRVENNIGHISSASLEKPTSIS